MKWKELLCELSGWSEERLNQQVCLGLEEDQATGGGFLREVMWTAQDTDTKRMFLLAGRAEGKDKEFKVSHVTALPNEYGLYGHVFIARDGAAWRAWAYRGPGGKTWEAGDTVAVPYEEGKPKFSALGLHCSEPIMTGRAPDSVVLEIWGEEQ